MKLSSNTIQTLKSLHGINQGIVITGGNVLKTISAPQRNILASAEIDEEFPACAFYNLGEFLSVISLFKDPDLEFGDKFVTISSGRSSARYFYSDPNTIEHNNRELKAPEMDLKFDISQEALSELIKGASILQLPELVLEGDGESAVFRANNPKVNSETSTFAQEVECVGEVKLQSFSMVFRTEVLQKLRPGSYTVEISRSRISRWTGDNRTSYYVSLEGTSKSEVKPEVTDESED